MKLSTATTPSSKHQISVMDGDTCVALLTPEHKRDGTRGAPYEVCTLEHDASGAAVGERLGWGWNVKECLETVEEYLQCK